MARSTPKTHALVLMDRAGWHCANDPVIPVQKSPTPMVLPADAPGLNASERLRLYLEERLLAHRLGAGDDAIVDAACRARRQVTSDSGRFE